MILQGAVIRQVVSRDVWSSAAFTVVVASRGSVNKFPGKCLSRQLSVQIIFVRHFLFQRSCVKVCLPINPFQGVETETRNYAHVPLKCASVRGMGKRELLSAGDPRLPEGGPGRSQGCPEVSDLMAPKSSFLLPTSTRHMDAIGAKHLR